MSATSMPWFKMLGQVGPLASLAARGLAHRLALAEIECEVAADQALKLSVVALCLLLTAQFVLLTAVGGWILFIASQPNPFWWWVGSVALGLFLTGGLALYFRHRFSSGAWFRHLREEVRNDIETITSLSNQS